MNEYTPVSTHCLKTLLEIVLRKSFQQYHCSALNVFRMEDFQL